MVGINMDMPKNCVECNHMDLQQAINCQLIYSGCANCGRHPNCPLLDIEERKVGKLERIEKIYRQWFETGDNADCWAFREIGKVLDKE